MMIGLIGYRGSGKSTIAGLLADRLGVPVFDTDQMIVERAGKSIRGIFEQDGEPVFRDMETDAVTEIARKKSAVIAFGGGALDREQNRVALAGSGIRLIYLRCEPGELLRRIQADPQTAAARPHLTHLAGSIDEIQTVLTRREPIWRTVMSAEIDVTRLSTAEVAQAVMERLAR